MNTIIKFTACTLLLGIVFLISCKKELSCENCKDNNKPPIADAGADQTITLPKDSVLLDGSGSTDADGTITSYKWIKIAGPVSSNISKRDSSKTMVRTLVAGVYKFELTVTDNDGLSAKDTIQVMVDAPGNQPPVACAGADQTITLPTNTVTLDGSCSADPDNNITVYQWTKIAGPSYNFANSNIVKTQVSNLVEGIYQFELKVTDSAGLFSKDTVQIAVADYTGRQVFNTTLTEIGTLSEPRIPVIGAAGSKIVFAGGPADIFCLWEREIGSSAVDIYDINTHVWTTSKLSKERSVISVANAGNKIFFAGGVNWDTQPNGWSYNVSYDNVDIYDVLSNTWSVAHLSKARERMSVAVVGNKVIFAGGDYFTGNLNPNPPNRIWDVSDVVDIYDLTTNTWSTARLSVPRSGISSVVVGDKVYFAGGFGYLGSPDLVAVDVYNSSTNTWSTSNLPEDIALKGSYQLKEYLIWSLQKPVLIKNLSTGNTATGLVSGQVLTPTGLKNDGIVFFPNMGGSQNNALTQFDHYNVLTGNWSVGKVPARDGTADAANITVNNKIYLAGGVTDQNGCFVLHGKVYVLDW